MNLNSHRKEIIKKIVQGEIYDLQSFLDSFNYLESYKLDADTIIKEFEKDENGREYKIPNSKSDFGKKRFKALYNKEKPDFTDDDFMFVKATPLLETPGNVIKYNDKQYEFLFYREEIKVAKDFSYLLEFVTLWQQLQKKGLIFEIDKDITPNDIALFYEIFPTKETPYYKKLMLEMEYEEHSCNNKLPEGLVKIPSYDCYEDLKEYGVSKEYFSSHMDRVEKNLLPYYEKYPVFNELHLTTCKDFINKKIVATPALREYVENNYQTEEEKKSKWALIGTWVAIGISFVMAAFSIFSTFNVDPSSNNLMKIQDQLEQISEDISNDDNDQLNQILEELNEIKVSKYDDAELQERIDSIINILNEIKINSQKDN